MFLVGLSWSGSDLRTVSATADERVSPTAIFKGLRVGSSATCVTLHQVMNETGRWRTLETCNDLHLGEDHNLLSLRDAQTGQRLTVDPICKAEHDWLAEKMGIPSRVDIVRVWDKQCKGSSSVDTLLLLFSIMSVSLAGSFITVLLDDAAKWWFWVSGITLPIAPGRYASHFAGDCELENKRTVVPGRGNPQDVGVDAWCVGVWLDIQRRSCHRAMAVVSAA
ncbi:hypothetical protein PINS_up019207 [Pythium insidiosum]|nr:hypothetical protein PINS_up019207 [Pythium insidiosum]